MGGSFWGAYFGGEPRLPAVGFVDRTLYGGRKACLRIENDGSMVLTVDSGGRRGEDRIRYERSMVMGYQLEHGFGPQLSVEVLKRRKVILWIRATEDFGGTLEVVLVFPVRLIFDLITSLGDADIPAVR